MFVRGTRTRPCVFHIKKRTDKSRYHLDGWIVYLVRSRTLQLQHDNISTFLFMYSFNITYNSFNQKIIRMVPSIQDEHILFYCFHPCVYYVQIYFHRRLYRYVLAGTPFLE